MSREKAFRYETEAAMCAAFIADAKRQGWVAYPETGGFDILLHNPKLDLQVAIEAKQQLNVDVILQATDSVFCTSDQGPDYRAILVPEGGPKGLSGLANRLSLTVIRCRGEPNAKGELPGKSYRPCWAFDPQLPTPALGDTEDYWWERDERNGWYQMPVSKRLSLPEYVPDVPAGAAAPVALTTWKIRAIKIDVLLEKRGYVTRADFKALQISMSRWLQSGWLDGHPTLAGAYVRGRYGMDFRGQHPRNYDEIAADFDAWSAKLPKPAVTPSMLEEVS